MLKQAPAYGRKSPDEMLAALAILDQLVDETVGSKSGSAEFPCRRTWALCAVPGFWRAPLCVEA